MNAHFQWSLTAWVIDNVCERMFAVGIADSERKLTGEIFQEKTGCDDI